jgi:hypothetical protein
MLWKCIHYPWFCQQRKTFNIFGATWQGNPASGAVHSPYKQAVGKRAAQGLLAKSAGTVDTQPFMPPSYASATASASAITVTLAAEGLYGSPPVSLNTHYHSIRCRFSLSFCPVLKTSHATRHADAALRGLP